MTTEEALSIYHDCDIEDMTAVDDEGCNKSTEMAHAIEHLVDLGLKWREERADALFYLGKLCDDVEQHGDRMRLAKRVRAWMKTKSKETA